MLLATAAAASVVIGTVLAGPGAGAASVGVGSSTTPVASVAAAPTTIELVSVKADGSAPGRSSWYSDVSANGRYVAFLSRARGLDPAAGTPRKKTHVYLRDLQAGTTTAVDVQPDGSFGRGSASYRDWPGYRPSVSADGRLVVFVSNSKSLGSVGRRSTYDVFVRDMVAGTTTIVSVTGRGRPANGNSTDADISADGSTVVFRSDSTNILPGREHRETHLYRRDLDAEVTTLVSKTPEGEYPDGFSLGPSLSADGALIAYATTAHDIVPGIDFYDYNIVLYDHSADASVLVNRPKSGDEPNGGAHHPAISADGTAVAYSSHASNLVRGDRNASDDIFVYDVASMDQSMVSRAADGGQTDDDSTYPALDEDGTHVVFTSAATNIVGGEQCRCVDVFAHDRSTQSTVLTAHDPSGAPADNYSHHARVSADGSVVSFESRATNLLREAVTRRLRIYVSSDSRGR